MKRKVFIPELRGKEKFLQYWYEWRGKRKKKKIKIWKFSYFYRVFLFKYVIFHFFNKQALSHNKIEKWFLYFIPILLLKYMYKKNVKSFIYFSYFLFIFIHILFYLLFHLILINNQRYNNTKLNSYTIPHYQSIIN